MKILFFIATLALQFLSVLMFKLLDNFIPIISIFITCMVAGLLLKYTNDNPKRIVKNLGWGLLYGSLSSVALLIAFMIWLSFNFPK
jgi:hypothetical protein